jgi:GDP-4-dehydro-6-deoxy-D-mannose reductase
MELGDMNSVTAAAAPRAGRAWEAVVHLAAIASTREAGADPGLTWNVNAGGTVRLCEALGRLRQDGMADPLLLLASSCDVYGRGTADRPRSESDPLVPLSTYASSKVAAEVAVAEAARRFGLRVIVSRPFPHTGPGQREVFVAPAFLSRLRAAARSGATEVQAGALETVRDLLDVRDVAAAYLALLERGRPGEVYNVASGVGHTLRELFDGLARLVGVSARPLAEVTLTRPWDVPHRVGDASRLRAATGWSPTIPFEQTLTDLVNAEAY